MTNDNKTMILENAQIRLEFDAAGRLCRLATVDGRIQTPIDAAGVTAPFEIQLRREGEPVIRVTPTCPPRLQVARAGARQILCLTWALAGAWGSLTVRARVVLPDDSCLSYWSMEIDNSTACAIFQVAYPKISGLTDFEAATPGWLAAPVLMGEKTPNPVRFVNHHEAVIDNWGRQQYGCFDVEGGPADIAYAYPGYWTLQFIAYGHPERGGIYFAAYDSAALYKCFGLYAAGGAGKHAALIMKQYPEDRTAAGDDFKSFYETAVGIYEGEWWNASAIYREWALDQFWAKQGPVKDRDDIPAWVKENDLWYWNWQFHQSGHPRKVVPIIKAIKQRYDCNLAFHWYGFNGEVFGASTGFRCPEIYPYCPDIRRILRQAVGDLHQSGVHCIPYLETRLWNPDTQSFKDCDGMRWVAVNEQGESADCWGGTVHTMCPTAPPFHELINRELCRMMDDCDMDGAYLDQVSGCYPVPCFNRAHAHGPGGHDHWVRGYRELLVKVRKSMRERKADSVITSEGVTECFLDLLDLDLAREIANLGGMVGSQTSLPIPMFHSVYHDYHITYGTVSTFKPRTAKIVIYMENFYYAEALALVGGTQLMISGPMAGDDQNEKLQPFFAYLETLVKTRMAGRKFFNLGVWKPPLAIDCDKVDVKYSDTLPPKHDLPAILSGCFLLDGELCVALVNPTETPRQGRFVLKFERYGLESDSVTVTEIYPEKQRLAVCDNRFSCEFSLGPLSSRLLVLKRQNN